jgi:tetratricopeptide (TPR) repeat protein
MKKLLLVVSFLIIPGLVGAAVYWKRTSASRQRQIEQARTLIGTRQGAAALEQLAARFPEDAEVAYLQAHQLRLDGQSQQAEVCLNRAANFGWPRPEVERQRWLCRANSDFREAESQLQSLLDLEPNDQDVLLSLAYGYSRLDRPAMANELVNRILKNDPQNGAALCLSGRIALQLRQADRANRELAKAMEIGKDTFYYATARLLRADALRQLGKVEDAYRLYQECDAETPNNFRILYQLGMSAHYLNRLEDALNHFENALRVQPKDVDTLLQLAYIHDEQREYGKVIELLKQVELDYPEEPQMLFQMAKTLKAQGNSTEATKYLQRYEQMKREWDKKNAEDAARDRKINEAIAPPKQQ